MKCSPAITNTYKKRWFTIEPLNENMVDILNYGVLSALGEGSINTKEIAQTVKNRELSVIRYLNKVSDADTINQIHKYLKYPVSPDLEAELKDTRTLLTNFINL